MVHEQLRAAATKAVAEYMGIAAEFVVNDALVEMDKNTAFTSDPDLQKMYFFVCLGKLLPPEVPYQRVKDAIFKSIGAKN